MSGHEIQVKISPDQMDGIMNALIMLTDGDMHTGMVLSAYATVCILHSLHDGKRFDQLQEFNALFDRFNEHLKVHGNPLGKEMRHLPSDPLVNKL